MSKAKIAQYRKAIIAAIGLAATIGAAFAPDNKYVIAGIAVATAIGVYRIPNVPAPQIPDKPDPMTPDKLPPSQVP